MKRSSLFLLPRLALLAMLVATPQAAATGERIAPDDLDQPLLLQDGWRWRAGDDPSWAAPALDDSDWLVLSASDELRARDRVSWFRRSIEIDPGLAGQRIGLYLDLRGAAQIFLDGEPIYGFGEMAAAHDAPASGPQRFGTRYRTFTLPSAGRHTLAVRYDQRSHRGFDWWQPAAGFRLVLGEPAPMMAYARDLGRRVSGHQMFFVGAFTWQALLHFFMFAFRRNFRS